MIKQAVLFVASTGFLLYFISPADKDDQKPSAIQESSEPKPDNQQNSSNAWEADDASEDDDFVFGEPLVYSENDKPPSENEGENEGKYAPAAVQETKIFRRPNYVSPAIYAKAPKPGAPGSKENPIDMSPPGGRQQN